jgi:hypothetical protein
MGERSKTIAKSKAPLLSERPSADEELAAYCPDLDQWPRSWMYEERDVSPGQQIVECFTPFLCHLLSLDLSPKTLRKHRDNLWLLGGEIISDLHEAPRLRRRPMDQVILAALDDEDGPLLSRGASEEQQYAFDATCRKFHRFLKFGNAESKHNYEK